MDFFSSSIIKVLTLVLLITSLVLTLLGVTNLNLIYIMVGVVGTSTSMFLMKKQTEQRNS